MRGLARGIARGLGLRELSPTGPPPGFIPDQQSQPILAWLWDDTGDTVANRGYGEIVKSRAGSGVGDPRPLLPGRAILGTGSNPITLAHLTGSEVVSSVIESTPGSVTVSAGQLSIAAGETASNIVLSDGTRLNCEEGPIGGAMLYNSDGTNRHGTIQNYAAGNRVEQAIYSHANEVGYTDLNGVTIPRNEATPTEDVLGGSLEYTGRAPVEPFVEGSPCLSFNGTNQRAEDEGRVAFAINAADTVTIDVWLNLVGTTGYVSAISRYHPSSDGGGWSMFFNDGKIEMWLSGIGSVNATVPDIRGAGWTHVVVTKTASTDAANAWSVEIDGQSYSLAGSGTFGNPNYPNLVPMIGAGTGFTLPETYFWNGQVGPILMTINGQAINVPMTEGAGNLVQATDGSGTAGGTSPVFTLFNRDGGTWGTTQPQRSGRQRFGVSWRVENWNTDANAAGNFIDTGVVGASAGAMECQFTIWAQPITTTVYSLIMGNQVADALRFYGWTPAGRTTDFYFQVGSIFSAVQTYTLGKRHTARMEWTVGGQVRGWFDGVLVWDVPFAGALPSETIGILGGPGTNTSVFATAWSAKYEAPIGNVLHHWRIDDGPLTDTITDSVGNNDLTRPTSIPWRAVPGDLDGLVDATGDALQIPPGRLVRTDEVIDYSQNLPNLPWTIPRLLGTSLQAYQFGDVSGEFAAATHDDRFQGLAADTERRGLIYRDNLTPAERGAAEAYVQE